MDNIFILELKRFFKENTKKILGLTLIIALLYVLFQVFLGAYFPNNSESEEGVIGEYPPASFKILIEEEDGTVFTNSTLIKEYFFLQRNVDELAEVTNINIENLVEQSIKDGAIKTPEELITFVRYAGSSLFELRISSSDLEKNLTMARYYHDKFFENDIPFLENRRVYEFTPPTLLELEDETLAEVPSSNQTIKKYLLNGVVGIVLGLFLSILLFLLKSLFSSRMTYSFAYEWEQDDHFQLYKSNLGNEEEIKHFIRHPKTGKKLVIHDQDLPDFLTNEFENISVDSTYEVVHSVVETNPSYSYAEVILMIDGGHSSKKWYRKQRMLLRNYQTQIKIIQY